MITAHQEFLENVHSRCLGDNSTSGQLRFKLRSICDVIVDFSHLNEDLQSVAKEELETRAQLQRDVSGASLINQLLLTLGAGRQLVRIY